MADIVYEWVTNIMSGLYDNSTSSIPPININAPIPRNISTPSIDNIPLTPIDRDIELTYEYEYTHIYPLYHSEQFTPPTIQHTSDMNTFESNPENHTMIVHGTDINTSLPDKYKQKTQNTLYDLTISIESNNLEPPQSNESNVKDALCKRDTSKLEVIAQEIEIEYIDNLSDDYDKEIDINSDDSSLSHDSQNISDGILDYIPTISSEESYMHYVQNVIINESDYSNQSTMFYIF